MNRLLLLVATCGSLLTSPLLAEESSEAPPQGLETTALVGVLDEVRGRIGREFVIDARVDDRVVTGQLDAADIDYHRLLVILRNNGLAAVEVGDITTIVPVEIVRQFPLPMLSEDDASVDDEEWITIVL